MAVVNQENRSNHAQRSAWLVNPLAVALVLLAALLPAGSPIQAASITPLGFLPGATSSEAAGVSAAGTVVVGSSNSVAFRWTRAGGMAALPGAGGGSSAVGVSHDGAVVAGNAGGHAFRWTSAGGIVDMGTPAGSLSSRAGSISGDGLVIVGVSDTTNGGFEAFRWTSAGGMVGLGDLPESGVSSSAWGTSYDGSVVAGSSQSANGIEAYRWTSAGGMVGLGHLPGGDAGSQAFAVSSDGAVVVGTSAGKPFRWTIEDGMVSLGDLLDGPHYSLATGVSADGGVVVGTVDDSAVAFLWTSGDGIRSLWDVLISRGISPAADGWVSLNVATDVSNDGRYVVGTGWRYDKWEAFLVDLQGNGEDHPVTSHVEIPADGSDQAGVGIVSGWHCTASVIEVQFDDLAPITAGSRTTREDTAAICGDSDNGFSLLWAYSLLGEGQHTAVLYADGVEFARSQFNVTLINGEEFVEGASGAWELPNFPVPGHRLKVKWDEASQNLVIFGSESMDE